MAALARPHPMEMLPGWGAAVSAVAFGVTFVTLPSVWLDAAIDASGASSVLSIAATPLGMEARVVLAVGGAALVAVLVWSMCRVMFGAGGLFAPRTASDDGTPMVRRADAHPDAPPRRPLSLADLGGIALPHDLDTPLSAIDPDAIPSVPREAVRPVAPLATGERLQIYALAVPFEPVVDSATPGIDALMRRLETGRPAV